MKRLHLTFATLVLVLLMMFACATIQTIMGKETPEKMALRFTQTWNAEYDRTIRLVTSHLAVAQQDLILVQIKDSTLADKAKADLLVANTNPNLTASQKELVNLRKKILVQSKPLITAFNTIVLSGKAPSATDQAQIEQMLQDLNTKYLIK